MSTESPTVKPTADPTLSPSATPTNSPSASPTSSPSASPTDSPSASPTKSPSLSPSGSPTTSPSTSPTTSPSVSPTTSPSVSPTASPTSTPSEVPSDAPSPTPSVVPTKSPEVHPTISPTSSPEASPTTSPTPRPTYNPSPEPSLNPTDTPCGTRASKVRIQANDSAQSIHVFEVQVYASDAHGNIAIEKAATQSSTFDGFDASRAIDGSVKTFSHTGEDEMNGWWEVDLGGSYHIANVKILNRYCGDESDPNGCLCRLSNDTLHLIDENNNDVASESFGDTCGELVLDVPFSDDPACVQAAAASARSSPTGLISSKAEEGGSSTSRIISTVVGIGVFLGLAFLAYKLRKRKQQQLLEEVETDDNLSPYVRKMRKKRSNGLDRKKSGEHVLNSLQDAGIMVDVKHSAAGGFNCLIDEDNVEQVGDRSSSASLDGACSGGSQQMQELVEIEEKMSDDWGATTDEDLVRAYNDALAIDVEPENETVAGLLRKYSRPADEQGNELDDAETPSGGHLA